MSIIEIKLNLEMKRTNVRFIYIREYVNPLSQGYSYYYPMNAWITETLNPEWTFDLNLRTNPIHAHWLFQWFPGFQLVGSWIVNEKKYVNNSTEALRSIIFFEFQYSYLFLSQTRHKKVENWKFNSIWKCDTFLYTFLCSNWLILQRVRSSWQNVTYNL